MKRAESNVEFTVFGDTAERVGISRRKTAPTHMNAESRMALFLTASGLIEGGYSPAAAGELICNEYQAAGKRMEAASTAIFFAGISGAAPASAAEMGDIAVRAFGRDFVGPEEMVLLRALPGAKDMAALFRMAATLVGFRFRLPDDRIPGPARRG